MYNSKYGELEFSFVIRKKEYRLFIMDSVKRMYTLVDENDESYMFNWDNNTSIPRVSDVRSWVLLGMPENPSGDPIDRKFLTAVSKERLVGGT